MKTDIPLNVLLVDDHELILAGLKSLLSDFLPTACLDTFTKGNDVFKILKEKKHNLYIIDIELKDISGIELIKEIREIYKESSILVNTLHEEIWYIKKLQALNVNGIIFKSNCCEKLNYAVTEILNGNSFFCDRFNDLKNNHQKGNNYLLKETFSKHEDEILYLIGQGYKIKEIANIKAWSEKTVENYRKRLFDKFGVQNVSRLVALAMKEGFLKKEDV